MDRPAQREDSRISVVDSYERQKAGVQGVDRGCSCWTTEDPENSLVGSEAGPETRACHVPGRVSRSWRLAHFLFQKALQAKREWIRRI